MRRGRPLRRTPLRAVSSKRRARREAEWSRLVRSRAGCRCEYPGCGRGEPLEAHHVIPRSVRPDVASDPVNGRALCPAHHAWVGERPYKAAELGLHGWSWDTPGDVADRYRLALVRHTNGTGPRDSSPEAGVTEGTYPSTGGPS